MKVSRRTFVKGGVTAFTFGFAAPQFLTDLAFAQAPSGRNLVILYLGGGNDALSTVVPYRDAAYYSRRPTLAVPAGSVLQIGSDSGGNELGLHPRLTTFTSDFRPGPARDHPAHRLSQFQPLALPGARHLGHGQSRVDAGHRLARTLPRHAAVADRSARRMEHYARNAPRADGAHGRRAGDHQSRHLRVLQPEHAAPKRRWSAMPRSRSRRICRSTAPILRS